MYNSYQFYLNLLLVLHLLFFFVQSMATHADDVQFFLVPVNDYKLKQLYFNGQRIRIC